jgi:hypothetical protein
LPDTVRRPSGLECREPRGRIRQRMNNAGLVGVPPSSGKTCSWVDRGVLFRPSCLASPIFVSCVPDPRNVTDWSGARLFPCVARSQRRDVILLVLCRRVRRRVLSSRSRRERQREQGNDRNQKALKHFRNPSCGSNRNFRIRPRVRQAQKALDDQPPFLIGTVCH